MRREEMIAIMGTMKVAYSRFYQAQTKEEVKQAVDLWFEMLKDCETADVVRAVKELIGELEFPPTIADVKKKVDGFVWHREWLIEAEKKEQQELEERQRFLERQKEVKLLAKPQLTQEEKQRYIDKCRQMLKGEEP